MVTLLRTPALVWATGVCIWLTEGEKCKCWLYRDDIGMRRGIKGYEEQAMIDKFH